MSLRLRLFLLLGTLLAVLAGAQWWLIRSLTQEVTAEVQEVAFLVGESMITQLNLDGPRKQPASDPEVRVVRVPPDGAPLTELERVWVARGEPGDEELTPVEIRAQVEAIHAAGSEPAAEAPAQTGSGPSGNPAAAATASSSQHRRLVRREVNHEVRYWYTTDENARSEETMANRVVLRLEDDGQQHGVLVFQGPNVHKRIPIPHRSTSEVVERFANRLLLGTFGILAVGLVLAGTVAHRVTAPLSSLAAAARQVGAGSLGMQVPVTASGEVGTAIQAFNRMSSHLQELDADARRLRARQHLGELGEVARGLAHSLRNPLNALGLSVDELSQGPAEEELRLHLGEAARRQIRRMDGAIRSFLALASGGAGSPEPVALEPLLQDVALEVLQDAGGKVRVEVAADPELPELPAVAPELRAVLQALVVNAAEASPQGGTVEIHAVASGPGRLRVEIADRGPGVPPAVRQRLFTPHVSTKPHGSGMGLYLAHRIATTRYAGNLELQERPGGGTCAVLELAPRLGNGEAPESQA